jgi:hypothetical protein
MKKKVPLNRLRDISKHRPIRLTVLDHGGKAPRLETIPVEWPIVSPTDLVD